jgi:hypothetical protein
VARTTAKPAAVKRFASKPSPVKSSRPVRQRRDFEALARRRHEAAKLFTKGVAAGGGGAPVEREPAERVAPVPNLGRRGQGAIGRRGSGRSAAALDSRTEGAGGGGVAALSTCLRCNGNSALGGSGAVEVRGSTGGCQLEVVWTFCNRISLIRHTRPGESERRTGDNRPRTAQVDSAFGAAIITAIHLWAGRDHGSA